MATTKNSITSLMLNSHQTPTGKNHKVGLWYRNTVRLKTALCEKITICEYIPFHGMSSDQQSTMRCGTQKEWIWEVLRIQKILLKIQNLGHVIQIYGSGSYSGQQTLRWNSWTSIQQKTCVFCSTDPSTSGFKKTRPFSGFKNPNKKYVKQENFIITMKNIL